MPHKNQKNPHPTVSTPHGGLATGRFMELANAITISVSTPHGGLATHPASSEQSCKSSVSTPHGGLATDLSKVISKIFDKGFNSTRWISNKEGVQRVKRVIPSFNSTRWISNVSKRNSLLDFCLVSTPHGGLATSTHHIKNNKTYQAFCQGGTPLK